MRRRCLAWARTSGRSRSLCRPARPSPARPSASRPERPAAGPCRSGSSRSPRGGRGSASLSCSSSRRPRARTSSRSAARTGVRVGSRTGRRARRRLRSTRCAPRRARRRAPDRAGARPPRPATLAPSVPDTTLNVSHWLGCTCAAATLPPGSARSSITTRSPPVSAAVSTNVIRSPVTGLTRVCPFSITSSLLARR